MKQNLYDNVTFFESYKALRGSKITYNDFIEQPAMKKLLPALDELNVLDLGCGFGELAGYCIDIGASRVTGIDLSEKMLEMARKDARISYIQSAMEDVHFEDNQFELVISSLAFHYVEDLGSIINRISKWLKPNGYLVFSTEHPIILAHKKQTGWVVDSDRNKLYWPLDDYSHEGLRTQFWVIEGVVKFHRKLSTILNLLMKSGFIIEELDEPESTPEGLERMPQLINETRRPSFLLVKARKRASTDGS